MSKRESELRQMRHFWRALKMVWPHKRYVLITILATFGVATAYTFSIATLYPVIKILVDKESIHDMVDLNIVQHRLGLKLNVSDVEDPEFFQKAGHKTFKIGSVKPKGALGDKGVYDDDFIIAVDGDLRGWQMIRHLAELEDDQEIVLGVYSPQRGERQFTAAYENPRWYHRVLRRAASYIEREAPDATPEERVHRRLTMLMYVLGVLMVFSIFGNFCRFTSEYYGAIVGSRTLLDIRRNMYAKVMMLPMSFFVSRGVSDTLSRFMQDSQDMLKALRIIFGKVLREPLKAFGMLTLALCVEPRLTVLIIIIAPAAALMYRKFGKLVRRANSKLLIGYGRLVGALEGTLSGIKVVKAYTMENRERRRYFKVEREILKQGLRIERVNAMSSPLLETLGVMVLSGGMIWVTREIMFDRISVAQLFILLVAMAAMLDPVRKLSNVYTEIQRANASSKRVFELIDMQTEFELSSGTRTAIAPKDNICFKDVTFCYPNSDHPAVDGVDLEVQAGKIYAVVGPNGSGKTTLVSLLLRLFDPESGEIFWDGTDLKEFNLRSLRHQISYVSQDAVVFADTVYNNIAYGNYQTTMEDVVAAARKAHAHDFIERLPQGYDTILGEHGTSISGGERQRLSIARAILRNAPVLIFDEATSQIDADSERKIQEAIDEFIPGRTSLVIAHRFSTIKKADKIVVMDQGQIVACGSHQELVKASPLYQTLYQTQLKGLEQDQG